MYERHWNDVKDRNEQNSEKKKQTQQLNKIIASGLLIPESVEKNYRCSICGFFMLNTIVQTGFGYLACKECYEEKLSENESVCPIEKKPFDEQEQHGCPAYFVDKAKEKEIGNLDCECPSTQCSWKGCVRDFIKQHQAACKYQPVCCQFCDESFERENENSHLGKCEGLFREGPCLYENVGCSFIAKSREEMKDHLSQAAQIHFIYQKKQSDQMEKKLAELTRTNTENKKEIQLLSKQQARDKYHMETQLAIVESTQDDFKKNLKSIVSAAVNSEKSNSSSLSSGQNKNSKKVIDTDSFTGDITKLNKDLSDLDLRFQLHENSTYDGTLLWKINNYTQRKGDAETGTVSALHSSPCFTSRYGYKYCLRLYLNGDGMGRGRHLSLFLVVMKSEYDNVMQWPFQKKVKFTMVNQVDRNRDVIERMMPDKNSSSFQKPIKDMNIASGCPQFISIDRLEPEGFLKDNSLFIEVNIS